MLGAKARAKHREGEGAARDHALLAVLAYTGCRVGELCRLKMRPRPRALVAEILAGRRRGARAPKLNTEHVRLLENQEGLDFATWKSSNPGYDKTSTASSSSTPPDSVTVFPNANEPKRAHIAVYNWTQAKNVTADVSGVLAAGDKYSLYSAQDFLAGPIKTGIVSGKTISIPMTDLTVASVLYCPKLTQPKSTSPIFGAFVLIGGSLD